MSGKTLQAQVPCDKDVNPEMKSVWVQLITWHYVSKQCQCAPCGPKLWHEFQWIHFWKCHHLNLLFGLQGFNRSFMERLLSQNILWELTAVKRKTWQSNRDEWLSAQPPPLFITVENPSGEKNVANFTVKKLRNQKWQEVMPFFCFITQQMQQWLIREKN